MFRTGDAVWPNILQTVDSINEGKAQAVGIVISVCMATHNGGRFIERQLESILTQLGKADEVVVVDDCSADHTVNTIRNFQDPRIRLLPNSSNQGVLQSFERAIAAARGDYLFFADQDDIWLPGKVEKVIAAFRNSGALAVVTDAAVVNEEGEVLQRSYFDWRGSRPGLAKNFHKNSFLGCCMAIRQECRAFLLPFPPLTYMHDQWAGMACSVVGRVVFLPEILLAYRRHDGTLTRMQRSPLPWIVFNRLTLASSLLLAMPRLLRWRRKMPAQR